MDYREILLSNPEYLGYLKLKEICTKALVSEKGKGRERREGKEREGKNA